MPYKSSVPLFWRIKKSKYNLIGTKCKSCNSLYFPARTLCVNCRRRGNLEEFKFQREGKIITYTIIRTAPEGFEKYTPYAVAIIKLNEGINVAGQIVDNINEISTGKKVRAVFRKMYEDGSDGLIHYGLKWEIVNK